MKRLLILLLLLLPGTAGATIVYLNENALGGANNGTSWAAAYTNADSTFLAATKRVARGDTVMVATGTYGLVRFQVAESDDDSIWVLKAKTGTDWADHGTATGWDDSLGTGQAEFTHAVSDSVTLWAFTTGNWIIDGGGRTSKTNGHGFKLTRLSPGKWVPAQSKFGGCYGVYVTNGSTEGTIHNFRFSYIEIQGVKDEFHYENNGCHFYFERGDDDDGGPENVTIEYCYSHDCDWIHIISGGSENWVVQHNYFHWNYSLTGYMHSEVWADYGSDDMIFRYNEVWDIEGSLCLGLMGDHGWQTDNWQIYGNVFGYTAEGITTQDGVANGIIANTTGDYTTNSVIYNNTFINYPCSNSSSPINIVSLLTGSTGNAVRNNLVYQGGLDGTFGNTRLIRYTGIHEDSLDYNTYIDAYFAAAYADSDEVHIEKGTGDPFTDLASGDVTLAADTDPGWESPYTTDALAVAYDAGGGWTRGAFAFDPGESGPYIRYVDRSKTEDGDGSEGDPWQSSQIAGSLEAGDTLYDITPTVTGANPLTIAVDNVTVNFKTGVGATPTIVGGLKPLTMTNQSTFGSDSVLVAANNDDSFLAEGHAYGWRNYYTSNSIDVLFFGEINTDRRTNIFAAFNFPESVTSVTSATLRCFVHYNSGASVKYDIRGILSKNVTPPSDSLTFQAFYADSLDAATAVSGTLSLAGGDSLNYPIATITDLVNAVLGVDGNTGRVGLMMLTDISGGSNSMRIEAYEEGAGRPLAIYYEYGTSSDYWAYAISEAEQAISAVYRDGVLMTACAALGDVNTAGEYFISADIDTLYVYGDGDGITADTYGPQLTIEGDNCKVYGGVFRHGNQSGAIKISGDSCLVANCYFDSSAVGIAVVAGATGTIIRNNVFRCSTAAIDDDGDETDEDYSAYVTGSGTTGLTDPLEITCYDSVTGSEEARDLGEIQTGYAYYGVSAEIGPVELEALVVATWHWDNGAMSRYGQPRPVSRYGRVPAVSRR